MAAVAAPTTTAEVAELHSRVTRFVFAHFHRKLSFEEASEVAAEAIGEADRATAAGQQIVNLNAWLRTASWRNAVSAIRHKEGEGRVRRLPPLDITEHAARMLDQRDPQEEVVDRDGARAEQEALARAWSRLARDEQRALHLRYFDELPVNEVLAVLGCSRHHYENLTKRALRKLREALIAGVRDDGCRACRTAVLESKLVPLAVTRAAERDAHLSSCLPCRAFECRQRGLIAGLPLPALGLLDRIAARIHTLGHGGSASQAGETAGAAALAGAGATAGAGAGGLVTAGGAAKLIAVVCSAGAVTAGVCVTSTPDRKPPRPEPRAMAAQAKPPLAPPTRTAAPLVPVDGATLRRPAPRAATHPSAPGPTRTQSERAAARARAEAARKASSPFLPESAAPPPAPPQTTTFASRAQTPATSNPSPPPSQRTAFSEEFTP